MLYCVIAPAFADNIPRIRGLNIDPVAIQSKSNSSTNIKQSEVSADKVFSNLNMKTNTILKGNVSELTSVVGKSRLIKFDEPVKRISITNPALADLVLISPKEMLLNGKQAGLTSLVVWGEKGDPAFFNLYVKNDSSQFLQVVKAALPDENLDFKFTNDTNLVLSGKVSSVVVRDQIKSLAEAYGYKLVDISESPVPQVMIEVKVAEASRSFVKNLKSNFALGKLSQQFLSDLNLPEDQSNYGYFADFQGGTEGLKIFSHKKDLTSALNFAETKGFVKTLAEPKLMATNGNKASFNAGQQIPFPSSIDMNGNVAYSFKDVGVNVTFTPTIKEKTGRISLNIAPEVSEIDSSASMSLSNGFVVYGYKTRKVDTTVELKDGQTLIMAGLLQKSDNSVKSMVPLLGDIPILGQLFRSDEFRKGETELLIFVTPKIIQTGLRADGV